MLSPVSVIRFSKVCFLLSTDVVVFIIFNVLIGSTFVLGRLWLIKITSLFLYAKVLLLFDICKYTKDCFC